MKSLSPQSILYTLILTSSSDAALTVTLHPDGAGGTTISIEGNGTTSDVCTSQLCNDFSYSEQWLGLTGNPFDDSNTLDNAIFELGVPIALTPTLFVTGIQIDNDNTGPEEDDFRIYVTEGVNFEPSTPYSVNGFSTLTTTLPFSQLAVGTYTDDTDGGTTFLGGFQLVISPDAYVPEPSSLTLLAFCGLFLAQRRTRKPAPPTPSESHPTR